MGDKANVNTPSPRWEAMEEDRELPRLFLYEGQRGLRDAGETYLPKYTGETGSVSDADSEYYGRLNRSYLVNFYQDAVFNIVGRIFQEPLVFSEDMPDSIRAILENVDNAGTHLDVFAHDACLDALGQGHTPVLVDMQRSGTDFANRQAEIRAGLRPFWVHWRTDRVIEAYEVNRGGVPTLGRLRVRDSKLSVDGYEYSAQPLVREYLGGSGVPNPANPSDGSEFAKFRIHAYSEGAGGEEIWTPGPALPMVPSRNATPEQRAWFYEPPVVPFYGGRKGFFYSKPPLLGVSDLNLQHWQKKSDLDNIELVANVPILTLAGGDGDTSKMSGTEIGAYRVVGIPEGWALSYLEVSGTGITHLKESIVHLEEHIRRVGKEPAVRQATGSELATVRLLDEAKTLSLAQLWAISWIGAINRCIELTGAWIGEQNPGSVSLQEDVMASLARPDSFDDVKELLAVGALSKEGALEEAKRYGVLRSGFDVADDLGKSATEAPSI